MKGFQLIVTPYNNPKLIKDPLKYLSFLQSATWLKQRFFCEFGGILHCFGVSAGWVLGMFSHRDHSFSTYTKCPKKLTFLMFWYAHVKKSFTSTWFLPLKSFNRFTNLWFPPFTDFIPRLSLPQNKTPISQIKAVNGVVLVYLLLIFNRFHALLSCFYCWLWTSKWRLGKVFLLNIETSYPWTRT